MTASTFNPAQITVEKVKLAQRHRATSENFDRTKNPFFKELADSKALVDAGKPEEAGRGLTVAATAAREATRWIRDAARISKLSARVDMFGLTDDGKRVPVMLGKQADGHDIVTKVNKESDWTGPVRIEFCAQDVKPRKKNASTPSVTGGNSAVTTTPASDAADATVTSATVSEQADNTETAPATDTKAAPTAPRRGTSRRSA